MEVIPVLINSPIGGDRMVDNQGDIKPSAVGTTENDLSYLRHLVGSLFNILPYGRADGTESILFQE
ncbi:hypothetical protein DMA11_23555 [Marinilabiliaceae bacterium JC017]|nr:hypothetical protein DMA11_23555 [Marinilabiliaceae bacterium JC017]